MSFHLFLGALKGVIVLLGSMIALLSYLAYRSQKASLMLYIAIGFGLLTLGSVIEGILFEILGAPLDHAHVVESATVLVGFLVLTYRLRPVTRGG